MSAPNSTPALSKGLGFALFGFAIYSSHDAIVKSLSAYSVFQIVFFAMLFAYVPFSIARIIDASPQSLFPKHPGLVVFRSLLFVTSLCLGFYAFSKLPLVEAYVLLFCTPILISIMAIFFLGEQIALVRWLAILLGLIGVIVVLRPSVDTVNVGHLAAFLSTLSSAASAIISRKIGALENLATMIVFPMLATILVSGAALFVVYQPMPLVDLGAMFLVGALGLLGQYSILTGYRLAPAAFVAPMQYSQIVWALLFGYLFFDESVDKFVIIGSAITIFSGIIIIWRERRVSKVQANLKTRNTRPIGGPMIKQSEADSKNT